MSRYTPDGAMAVKKAMDCALQLDQTSLTPAHLLYGILSDRQSPAVLMLRRMHVDLPGLESGAAALLSSPFPKESLVQVSESAQQGQDALTAALSLGSRISSTRLLQGLTELNDSATARLLDRFGVTAKSIMQTGSYV